MDSNFKSCFLGTLLGTAITATVVVSGYAAYKSFSRKRNNINTIKQKLIEEESNLKIYLLTSKRLNDEIKEVSAYIMEHTQTIPDLQRFNGKEWTDKLSILTMAWQKAEAKVKEIEAKIEALKTLSK